MKKKITHYTYYGKFMALSIFGVANSFGEINFKFFAVPVKRGKKNWQNFYSHES